ncbi:hypothetical protein [Streptomyces sp. NPDC047976]|uniref:hypothetical protein n=1 Tax=Streptomyces sp. NPDC047976 TaxID=3155746 RepID=UPI003432CFB0
MAEQQMDGYMRCGPCPSCRFEAWQRVVDGRLRWEESQHCAESGTQACGGGWGPPPPWVRERIVAEEGTVRLAVGGPDGLPLKAVRALYGLTLPELREAREHGIEATPVEAGLLAERAAAAEPGRADSSTHPVPPVTAPGSGPAGPG